jgi:hypothetical protein
MLLLLLLLLLPGPLWLSAAMLVLCALPRMYMGASSALMNLISCMDRATCSRAPWQL